TASSSASAAGATSRRSPSTIMYSTSMPNASKRPRGLSSAAAGGPASAPGSPSARLLELLSCTDARLDNLDDAIVKLVAEHGVLDAVVDVRVVVDLHEHVTAVDGLDVDAVQAVADRVGRAQREIEDLARRMLHGDRLGGAFGAALLAVVVDL